MNGYECADCGETFEFPTLIDETSWEDFQGHRVRHEECTPACPFCEGDDIEEITLCPKCKADRTATGFDYCFACLPPETLADDKELIMRNT